MISLKKFLDQQPEKLAELALDAYREAMHAVGEGSVRVCPSTAETLRRELSKSANLLKKESSAGTLRSANVAVVKGIRVWGEQTENYLKRKTAEIKEMLTELARSADFLCRRDQRYAAQFTEISRNLDAVIKLEDLSRIRASVLHSASELRGCVERMAREGAESIVTLQASVTSFQARLEQAEELASLDPLTGLYNRREIESRLTARVTAARPFCVVIIDLNDFRTINDSHGHLVGDELLRQMAKELRLASRSEDLIGRWGGNQFILVLDGSFTNTKAKIDRMRPWILGTYELEIAESKFSVVVSASIGMAEWAPGERMLRVLSRADAEMHREKVAHAAVR
jgi:diguanylate cyclase (GGDEF)-like protein